MKTATMNLMIAVAALAVAAGSASAQTFKTQIPVPFSVNNTLLAPGSYEVRMSDSITGVNIVSVHNVATNRTISALPGPKADTPKEWLKDGTPRLTLLCGAGSCTLTRMWNGDTSYAYGFGSPDKRTIEARGMTVVTLAMIKIR